MSKSIKRVAIVGLTLGATMTAGLALAAWTASGTGSGTSKAVTAEALTTSAAVATADLYPGKTNGGLRLTINNTNDYPVTVTSVTAGTGSVTAASGIGTCTTTGVSLNSGLTNLSIVVLANDSTTTTVPNAVTMTNASDTGCQDATFTIPVTLGGVSGTPSA